MSRNKRRSNIAFEAWKEEIRIDELARRLEKEEEEQRRRQKLQAREARRLEILERKREEQEAKKKKDLEEEKQRQQKFLRQKQKQQSFRNQRHRQKGNYLLTDLKISILEHSKKCLVGVKRRDITHQIQLIPIKMPAFQ